MRSRLLKISSLIVAFITAVVVVLFFYVRHVARIDPPKPRSLAILDSRVSHAAPGVASLGHNWFRKSESGLYELYVEGDAFDRGVAIGKLTEKLVQQQEEVFTDQIHKLVPSNTYLNVLKYFIGWFNRDLTKNVPEEYQLEIFGVSQAASHAYDDIAPPYQRILNYHAAHDIGHALQNMSLVGCTSFATWGKQSEDSTLIIGRNFDFYVGDDFAKDKIVAFYNPSEGNKFMMVTFGGMTGVLSGMNEQGLTVTINAAKSEMPSASATPVSIVARAILQYATSIEEAYTIAGKYTMFVSESFLIGSAKDGKAALIEKSPDAMELVATDNNYIISTNHFQGKVLGETQLNKDHIATSASPYRYARVKELLVNTEPNSVAMTASILRNQLGLHDADIGMGNEKAINQLVAHHGIIFQPQKKLVWLSTAPWQLGKFVCYDLNKIFAMDTIPQTEVYERDKMIAADSFINTQAYDAYLKFSKYRFPFTPHDDLHPDSIVQWNPNSYHAYMLAGDQCLKNEEWNRAMAFYEKGLTKEVATVQEREHMEKNLQTCKEHLP